MEDKFMESVQKMVAQAIKAQADKEIEVQKKSDLPSLPRNWDKSSARDQRRPLPSHER